MRALKGILTVVVGVYVFAWGVHFLTGGRTVAEPREIGSEQITPPGTELRVGEEAFVAHQDRMYGEDRHGIVAITVTAIEPGAEELFHRTVDNSEGFAPYYIRATVENVSGEDLGDAVFAPSLGLAHPDEGPDATLFDTNILSPGLGSCRGQNFPSTAGLGTVIETCEVDIVREGSNPAGAQWQPHDTPYQSEPIVWLH